MMTLKKIVPQNLRIIIKQFLYTRKYDVKFGKLATASNTKFEGYNIIRSKAHISNSFMGIGSYISENTILRNVEIGRFTCVGTNVKNHFGQHPSSTFVSIHPAFYSIAGQAGFTFTETQLFEEHIYIDSEKKVVNRIGNDVWIGANVLIMEGVLIGDGAIVAAGSVVTKNIPPYSIVGGVPAKIIRKRFTDVQIEFLLRFKWWERDLAWLSNHSHMFSDIKKFIRELDKNRSF